MNNSMPTHLITTQQPSLKCLHVDYFIDDPSSPRLSGPRQGKYLPREKVQDSTLRCQTCFPGDFRIDLLTLLPATEASETLRSSPRVGQSSQQGADPGGEQTLTEHSDSWSSVHWAPSPRTGWARSTWKNWCQGWTSLSVGTGVRCQGPVRRSHGPGYKSEKSLFHGDTSEKAELEWDTSRPWDARGRQVR